jgi:hypothetical protein
MTSTTTATVAIATTPTTAAVFSCGGLQFCSFFQRMARLLCGLFRKELVSHLEDRNGGHATLPTNHLIQFDSI